MNSLAKLTSHSLSLKVKLSPRLSSAWKLSQALQNPTTSSLSTRSFSALPSSVDDSSQTTITEIPKTHNSTQTYPITKLSISRMPSAIRALQDLYKPGMISLGGGLPNPLLFPIESITLNLKNGTKIEVNDKETKNSLQYTSTLGLPSLVKHLKELQSDGHSVDFENGGMNMIVTNGGQSGLAMAFEMLLESGDSMLVECPTYSGSLAFLDPYGVKLFGVKTDEDGLIPSDLQNLLTNWDSSKLNGAKKPRVLYTIPTGLNPSGGTLSVERKYELYKIAEEHDLIILEDDPYYYLDLDYVPGSPRAPSMLRIDMDNGGRRVLRFDSFSKLLSAGLRCGFCTGPEVLIERLELHTQATLLHASGMSQTIVSKMFDHWGGVSGFYNHVDNVGSFYALQRTYFINAAKKHLTGLVKYRIPKAGMFAWMDLIGVTDSESLIMQRAVDAKVIFVPGQSFIPTENGGAPSKTGYIRASFSIASESDMDEACRRLAVLLKEDKKEREAKKLL